MDRVSSLTICQDESGFILQTLEWLRDYIKPDQYVIVDGGSKDNTVDKIKYFQKQNNVNVCLKVNEMLDSFSEQRNIALAEVTSEWVLQIDTDETYSKSISQLIDEIRVGKHRDVFGFIFPTANLILDTKTIHADRGPEPHLRLYRKDIRAEYYGDVHEHISFKGEWIMRGIKDFKIIHKNNIALKHYALLKNDAELLVKGKRYMKWAQRSAKKGIPLSGEKYFIERKYKLIKEGNLKEIPKEWE
ncbi:hypothetical protein ES705_39418 [subsurface metagenome]